MAMGEFDPRKPVNGQVYNATEDGFARLVDDANRAHKAGYMLLAAVPLMPKHVGALFVKRASVTGPSLVDEW